MFMDNRLAVYLDLSIRAELLHIQLLIQMNHAVQDQLRGNDMHCSTALSRTRTWVRIRKR